jgi:hypothetical protein
MTRPRQNAPFKGLLPLLVLAQFVELACLIRKPERLDRNGSAPEVPAYLVRSSWPTLGEHGGLRPQKWDHLSRQGKDLIDSGKNLTSFPVQ